MLLNIYLLKIEIYKQVFQQKLFTANIFQISSSKIVLSQVFIRLSPFSILHYINVISVFVITLITFVIILSHCILSFAEVLSSHSNRF